MAPIIIIGAGLAGYQLAREFRKINQTSPLMLITADDGRYYSKPQLSTALTQGKTSDTLTTATADTMANQLNATIRTRSDVTAIDPAKKNISINNEIIHYHKLVLACGATVIKPELKGDAVSDVLSINHIYHYATFQDLIKNKKHITILGAGLIGCEFANDLSNIDYIVDVIAPISAPLEPLIPVKIGKLLQTALEQNGVTFHFGCTAHSINKIEQKYHLELSNGKSLETEFVLSAIGLKPHVSLAENAKIKINRGIIVNRYLETSAPDIYALGDCAEVEGHVLPFITPLLNAGRALAKTLASERTALDYPAMPIIVKTPSHPIVVCPPPKNIVGHWEITENSSNNGRALFYSEDQKLYGFVLTNQAVKERAELVKQIPALF
jgi:rubredoxin-NAD+ reductase